ncbi:MAG: hypothetical protein M1827_000736 [Pycnora praestabilis]|nr:MAG: hypothetical protein M1827_000736 [Pycnora praestabilis]
MDSLKNAIGMGNDNTQNQQPTTGEQKGSGGFLGGIGDKLNTAAGGGKESEKNEDLLDKGVDAVQQYGLGQGPQDNESAVEQAKDEQISDYIRDQYHSQAGKDFPIADKNTKLG